MNNPGENLPEARSVPPHLPPPLPETPPPTCPCPPPPVPAQETTGTDVIIGVAILMSVDLLTGIALAIGHAVSGVLHDPQYAVNTGKNITVLTPASLFFTFMISSLMMCGVCWYFLCHKYHRSLRDGMALHKVPRMTSLVAVLTGIMCGAIGTVLMALYGTGKSYMAHLSSTLEGLSVLTIVALTSPWVEELYYRGFIFPALQQKVGKWSLAIIVAWFTAIHVPQLLGDAVGIVIIMVMATIWTWQRYSTGSLVPCILSHLAYNATTIAFAWCARWCQF